MELEKQTEEIKKWLKEENIRNAPQDTQNILRFLAGCKYKTDKTKKKIKNFYEARTTTSELFQGRDPFLKNIESLLDLGAFFPLPEKPEEGHTLLLVKAGANDPRVIPMTDVFKIGIMSMDLLMKLDDGITKTGVGLVVDLKGVGLHHGLQMTPNLIRKMVHLWQDCYPIRILGIDFVNAPRGVDLVLNVFRKFLAENLKQKLRVHGSQMESLHAVVDRKFLPQEYGGDLGPVSAVIQEWKSKVQAHRQWFLDDETLQ